MIVLSVKSVSLPDGTQFSWIVPLAENRRMSRFGNSEPPACVSRIGMNGVSAVAAPMPCSRRRREKFRLMRLGEAVDVFMALVVIGTPYSPLRRRNACDSAICLSSTRTS